MAAQSARNKQLIKSIMKLKSISLISLVMICLTSCGQSISSQVNTNK
jgi:hypothetical protein